MTADSLLAAQEKEKLEEKLTKEAKTATVKKIDLRHKNEQMQELLKQLQKKALLAAREKLKQQTATIKKVGERQDYSKSDEKKLEETLEAVAKKSLLAA